MEGPTPQVAFAKLWWEQPEGGGKPSAQLQQQIASATRLGPEAFGLTGCALITSFIQGLPGAERYGPGICW